MISISWKNISRHSISDAYEHVDSFDSKGGRLKGGNYAKGGIREYARRHDLSLTSVTRWYKGYEVFKCSSVEHLKDMPIRILYQISKAPEIVWQPLVETALDEDWTQIVELYLRGWNTQEDIAENVDCIQKTVSNVIENSKKTQMRRITKEWNLSSKDEDYNKRKPFTKPDEQDIADEVGCHKSTISRLLQKRKISDLQQPDDFEPKNYKVWNYSSCDNAVEWTGNIPQDIADVLRKNYCH